MRTRAIIHLNRFLSNFDAVKARVGQTRICVPVKADAYGHGALEIARASLQAGAFCLGVTTVYEGAELRNGGIKAPILLFSQPDHHEIPDILKMELIPFISDIEFASILDNQTRNNNTKIKVHIKIDTGMGRIGCPTEEALSLARFISSCSGLELNGTATHFAVSDSADEPDIAYTLEQLKRFKEAVKAITDAGINPGIVHTANSGAILLHPDTWFDMVRPGILLYGYNTIETPNTKIEKISGFEPVNVQPVMELRTIVTLIKKIKKGESVSYGRTWKAPHDTYIAILPLGYADGLPRIASNKWQAVINGKSYPIVGRICMDLCCVDLGPEPDVQRWSEAVIFGGQAKSAADLAAVVGTIPYEITCNINKRVPRVIVTE